MKGHCLCGAVGVEAPDNREVGLCHCGICRRWGGGPLFTLHCGSRPEVTGEGNITIFRSSEWAERAFCGKCGSHLYYHLLPTGEHYLAAGLFQDEGGFRFTEQIFVDMKPDFYDFSNETKTMTEAEVFANFAPPE